MAPSLTHPYRIDERGIELAEGGLFVAVREEGGKSLPLS